MAAKVELAGRNEILRLRRELGEIPRELQRRLRPLMRREGQPVLQDARRRASWSTRIPPATKLSTSFTRRRAGLHIQVDRRRAPHARNWEDLMGRGESRWPVFGNREVWSGLPSRPFLEDAAFARGPAVVAAINQAIDQTAREMGFR